MNTRRSEARRLVSVIPSNLQASRPRAMTPVPALHCPIGHPYF
jgi:hypothetical protein